MLLYFLLGILFFAIGIPILEAISSTVSAISQYIVYIFALKIYKIKKEMEESDQEEQQETQVMGFTSAIGQEISGDSEFWVQEE